MPHSSTRSSRIASRGSKSKRKPAGLTRMLSSLPVGKSKAKSAPSGRGKKGAGLALLTAAAGFALANRDKIGGLVNRQRQPVPPAPAPSDTSPQPTP